MDLAAYLVEVGYTVREYDWETLRSGCLIVFEETTKEVENQLAKWNCGLAVVNARTFPESLRSVKRNLIASRPAEIRT